MASVEKSDLNELELKFQNAISEARADGQRVAERRRNEALGVFAAIGVLLGFLGYFGLEFVAEKEIKELGAETILAKAEEAAAQAAAHESQAEAVAERMSSFIAGIPEAGYLAAPPGHHHCEWVKVNAGGTHDAVCPAGKYLAGVRQMYHGGSWRNWIDHIKCCVVSP